MARLGHDPDKRDVYAAEWSLRSVLDLAESVDNRTYNFHGHIMELPRERKFADLESIQRYYNAVCELDLVQREWPGIAAPRVMAKTGYQDTAHYSFGEVHVPTLRNGRWSLREIVILHELAHHLEHDSHGPEFRGAFVYLVQVCMGPELALVLSEMLFTSVGKPFVVRGLQNA